MTEFCDGGGICDKIVVVESGARGEVMFKDCVWKKRKFFSRNAR